MIFMPIWARQNGGLKVRCLALMVLHGNHLETLHRSCGLELCTETSNCSTDGFMEASQFHNHYGTCSFLYNEAGRSG